MLDQQAVSRYRHAQVMTASPERLLLMTYQALARFLEAARASYLIQDWNSFREQLLRAQDAVNELQVALDFDNGGEIAVNLYQLYHFIRQELIRANISRNMEPVENVLPIVQELRDAWGQLCHA